MFSTLSAGTHSGNSRGRPAQEPHTFVAEKGHDWGYRPRCGVCGQERSHPLHPKQVRKP